MNELNRFICRVQALLLGLLFAGAVLRAASLSASHEAATQQLISNLQLHERFMEQGERYIEFMRSRAPNPAIVAHVGTQLKFTNVMEQMTNFIAAQFSEAELTEINAYLETKVGRNEYELVLALVNERRTAPAGSVDTNARVAAFKQSLSPKDRDAAEAFRASPTGQKYWSQLEPIDRKLTEVFTKRCDDILQKLAANATKTEDAKTPTNKTR